MLAFRCLRLFVEAVQTTLKCEWSALLRGKQFLPPMSVAPLLLLPRKERLGKDGRLSTFHSAEEGEERYGDFEF